MRPTCSSTDAPAALLQKIEQVVRLIRSKGVGVFFVTQNPLDVPDIVLGQLGNRIQHALRAFTPRDLKAVRVAAETLRLNPALDAEKAIGELAVGEALVSFLDGKGQPEVIERAFIRPPLEPDRPRRSSVPAGSHPGIGPLRPLREGDRPRIGLRDPAGPGGAEDGCAGAAVFPGAGPLSAGCGPRAGAQRRQPPRTTTRAPRPAGRPRETMFESMAKSAVRSMGSQIGRSIMRGVLGGILGRRGGTPGGPAAPPLRTAVRAHPE